MTLARRRFLEFTISIRNIYETSHGCVCPLPYVKKRVIFVSKLKYNEIRIVEGYRVNQGKRKNSSIQRVDDIVIFQQIRLSSPERFQCASKLVYRGADVFKVQGGYGPFGVLLRF